MSGFRSIIQNLAERVFGRLLPQVKARADCSSWEPVGCCGPLLDQWEFKRYCYPPGQWEYSCSGPCAT